MTADETWVPPTTREVVAGDGRVVRYCCYGPPRGVPACSLPGTPGTRWERPDVISAFDRAALRVVVPDRPGYGGSTRQPGRTVADAARDVRLVADAQGWERFAVTGFSGGGPHALACAALLADRVTCCAVVACPAPPGAPGVDFFGRQTPGQGEAFRRARLGEPALRPYLESRAADAVVRAEAGGPLLAPDPGPSAAVPGRSAAAGPEPPPPADPGRIHRIRAMFLGGLDGWVDDDLALIRPWGFDLGSITVPVSVWYGASDARVPRAHADGLLALVPAAQAHEYPGGHEPGDADLRRILAWIAAPRG